MSSHASTPGMHLQTLVLDESFTVEQKADCLKVMKLIIKNLADPVKAQDAKYRQVKLSNAKIQEKLVPVVSAMNYLKAIGFVETVTEDDIEILRVVEQPDIALMKASLQEVTNALDMVAPNTTTSSATRSIKKPRVEEEEEEKKSDDPPPPVRVERLSEKQKARMLMEEKEKREKEIARKEREKTRAQIKQDKFVRENDSNWKSGVSAACAKSGSGIETFRGRHGED